MIKKWLILKKLKIAFEDRDNATALSTVIQLVGDECCLLEDSPFMKVKKGESHLPLSWFEVLCDRFPEHTFQWTAATLSGASPSSLKSIPVFCWFQWASKMVEQGHVESLNLLQTTTGLFKKQDSLTQSLWEKLCSSLPPHFDEIALLLPDLSQDEEERQRRIGCLIEICERAPEQAFLSSQKDLGFQISLGHQFQNIVCQINPNLDEIFEVLLKFSHYSKNHKVKKRHEKFNNLNNLFPLLAVSGAMLDKLPDSATRLVFLNHIKDHPVYGQIAPGLNGWKEEFERAALSLKIRTGVTSKSHSRL